MRYANPNTKDSKVSFKEKYEIYWGKWVAPVDGEYFEDISPVDGKVFAKVAKSNKKMLSWHWMQQIKPNKHGINPRRANDPTCF